MQIGISVGVGVNGKWRVYMQVLAEGAPEVALGHPQPERWFDSFTASYVERDLRQLSQVADLVAFRRLLQLASLRTAASLGPNLWVVPLGDLLT